MKKENKLNIWKEYASNGELLTFDLTQKDAVYIINKKRLSNDNLISLIDLNASFQNGYIYIFSHDFDKQKYRNKLEVLVNEYLKRKDFEEMNVYFYDLKMYGKIRADYYVDEHNHGKMTWEGRLYNV